MECFECKDIHRAIADINKKRIIERLIKTGGKYSDYDSTYTCNKCHRTFGMRLIFNEYEVIN